MYWDSDQRGRDGKRSVVRIPLPSLSVRLLEPLLRAVSVPLPSFVVVPVTVLPSRLRSVVRIPLPSFSVRVVDPLLQLVIVPLPSLVVVPESVFPSLVRTVVRTPLPSFSVRTAEPSLRLVSVPLPSFVVVPVRVVGGSAAYAEIAASKNKAVALTRMVSLPESRIRTRQIESAGRKSVKSLNRLLTKKATGKKPVAS